MFTSLKNIFTARNNAAKNEYEYDDELGWWFITFFVALLASGIVLAFAILI